MNKKEKSFILIGIVVLIMLLMFGIYIQSNNKTNIGNQKINISVDDSKLNIFYFYVGQADCTLIINNGKTMLIDAGDKTDGKLIANCLKQLGIEKIDYLIGTHSDDDHIGGMINIVNNFEIQNLYMPQKEANNQSYIELKKNINIQKIEINDIVKIGEATAIVKWVDNEEKYSDNNSSIVLQLNYKDKKYLFTGDIETKVENELIKQNTLEEIDVLKVAHHGSNSSTSEKFLNAIKPKSVIISSGSTYNKFPNVECLKRILKLVNKESIFITERDGTIWITSDGITVDNIQKLNEINLDGAKSQINQNELGSEYLESIQISMFSFFEKTIENINEREYNNYSFKSILIYYILKFISCIFLYIESTRTQFNIERRMPLKLDLGLKLANNILQNKEISNFIQELSNTLKDNNVLVYKDYDSAKFTRENEEKLWGKKEKLISESITENNIENSDQNKLYEISYKNSNGYSVIEFNEKYSNRNIISVDNEKLPQNTETGMFFRKVGDNYVFDKVTTEKIYNEMTSFQNELVKEQKEMLNDMRQDGAIYKVTYLEDDCEDWRTEVTNQKTGEVFQELEFPHDVYHQVGVDSLVKYENGKYSVVEGTSVYDLYPNIIENYCENEGVYITQNGKCETANELYKSINKSHKDEIIRKVTNAIEKILKFTVDKLVELIKNKQ